MADYPRGLQALPLPFFSIQRKFCSPFAHSQRRRKAEPQKKMHYLIQEFCLYKQAISRPFDASHALQAATSKSVLFVLKSAIVWCRKQSWQEAWQVCGLIERVSVRVSDGNGPAVASIGCDPFLPFGSKNITSPVAKTKNHRHRCAICENTIATVTPAACSELR